MKTLHPEEDSFGKWLRRQRRIRDLTQQELADQVGIARITLRRIETGTLKPSKELASLLLEQLGIPKSETHHWISFARGDSPVPLLDSQPLNNLPAFLTTFIGRKNEQAVMQGLVSKYRLVTLVGPGGVGKTRLAVKVGEGLLGHYLNGVWLLELAPLQNAVPIQGALANLFGIRSQSNATLLEALINYLRAKSALLIFDNCEHLLDEIATLASTLLKNCPKLKILATSREPLGIAGEALYQVPPLGIPDVDHILDALKNYEAVCLFEERAQLAKYDFSLTLENAGAVVQICRCLDGIPLALELAAAQVNILTVAQIAKELQENFNLLKAGSRTVLPRQQTIRASIDWSWELLTNSERALLRRLSVFIGGWTLESATTVCSMAGLNFDLIPDLLSTLVKKSLVVVNQEAEDGGRFHLHEIIRQYAREKLGEAGEESVVLNRHLHYHLQLTEHVSTKILGIRQWEWSSRLDEERGNIRVALGWSLENNPVAAFQMISNLADYWLSRGHLIEGQDWCSLALNISQAYPEDGGEIDKARAKTLYILALMSINKGEHYVAKNAAVESIHLARQAGDLSTLTCALNTLGFSSIFLGDTVFAFNALHESEAIARQIGDMEQLAWTLHFLAFAEMEVNGNRNAGKIREYLTESLSLRDASSNQQIFSRSEELLARLDFMEGNIAEAMNGAERILDYYQKVGDQHAYNTVQSGLAHAWRQMRHFDKAIAAYRTTLVKWQEIGNRGAIAHQLECVAFIAKMREQEDRAIKLLGAAEALREISNSPRTPMEQNEFDQICNDLRDAQNKTTRDVLWREGRNMNMEEAIALALRVD